MSYNVYTVVSQNWGQHQSLVIHTVGFCNIKLQKGKGSPSNAVDVLLAGSAVCI